MPFDLGAPEPLVQCSSHQSSLPVHVAEPLAHVGKATEESSAVGSLRATREPPLEHGCTEGLVGCAGGDLEHRIS